MLLFFVLASTDVNIQQNLDVFSTFVDDGQLEAAKEKIADFFRCHSTHSVVRKKYAEFLMQTGEYDVILNVFKKDAALVKEANELKNMSRMLKSNAHKIYLRSPYYKPVVIELIKSTMLTNMNECNKLLAKAKILFKDDSQIAYLQALYHAIRSENEKAYDLLYRSNNKMASQFKDAYLRLNSIKKDVFDFKKMEKFVKHLWRLHSSDEAVPSLFYAILINSLIYFIKNGAEEGKNVIEYARLLCQLDKKDGSFVLYIKALLAIKKFDEAERQLTKISNKNLRYKIEKTIRASRKLHDEEIERRKSERENKKKKEEQKRKDEEKRRNEERRRYEEQQKRQQYSSNDHQANDSKGYYKLLGVKPNASSQEIKKKYNRLVLKYDVDRQKRKLTEKEKEDLTKKLAAINQARDVLLNPKKRKLYDSGMLDQQGQKQPHSAADNEQVRQMFEAFFGQGSGQSFFFDFGNNRGFRRSQTFYFV